MMNETTEQKAAADVANRLDGVVICDEASIVRVTIEWNRVVNEDGLDDARALLERKYNGAPIRTVRLGPKVIDFPKVSNTISQWIADIYI
jgi:hypothetical protein